MRKTAAYIAMAVISSDREMSDFSISDVVTAVRDVVPDKGAAAELHEPEFSGNEWKYIKSCLDEGCVSTAGSLVDRYEKGLAAATRATHAIATINGTAALHAALTVGGVKSGDEVLVPSLTFVATANAVRYCGAEPHFVDCESQSLGIDATKLESYLDSIADTDGQELRNRKSGRPIRALVSVHLFGHPSDMAAISGLAGRFKLTVIEDATEALGSRAGGKPVGGDGLMAALSFNGNKIITTGGGGAILTNNDAVASHARHITTTAKVAHTLALEHDEVGFNYRMPNINAAMGVAQLEKLNGILERKQALAEAYRKAFEHIPGVTFHDQPPGTQSNFWLNTILLDPQHAPQRDSLIHTLHENGLMCRPAWTPMHRLPMYRDCPAMPLETTEEVFPRLVCLPSSPYLSPLSASKS